MRALDITTSFIRKVGKAGTLIDPDVGTSTLIRSGDITLTLQYPCQLGTSHGGQLRRQSTIANSKGRLFEEPTLRQKRIKWKYIRMHALQLLPLGLAYLAVATAAAATTTTLTIAIPASHFLPNPNALHPSTSGTLTHKSSTSSDINGVLSAPLSAANTLVFRNVSAGSYLFDLSCGSHAFIPLRVDVFPTSSGSDDKVQSDSLEVRAWETYRGNDWNNKGEAVAVRSNGAGGLLEARVMGPKAYFMDRPAFSVLSIFKNPMILLGLVSMVIFIGMPYLVDNSKSSPVPKSIEERHLTYALTVDPEMKAEYEERQKKNPMNSLLGGASGGQAPTPMGNFDMAAYLAGSGQSKGKK